MDTFATWKKGTVDDVVARIERMPISSWHLKARFIVGVATFFDGFDALAIAYVLPVIGPQWHLSQPQIGLLLSASFFGQLLAALFFGWFAERYGRMPAIIWSTLIYSVMSLACAFAWDFNSLLFLRTLQGIGIGGEVPVAITYIAELSRAERRGRFLLLYELVFPIGLVAAVLVGALVVSYVGWQWLFVIGALPALVIVFMQRLLPESPRWLATKGRYAEADAVVSMIERAVERSTGPLPPAQPVVKARERAASLSDLFGSEYLGRTLSVWVIWAACFFCNFGLVVWLPSIYRTVFHLSVSDALVYTLVTQTVGLIACLICALWIDAFMRRVWFAGAFLGATVFFVWLGYANPVSPEAVVVVSSAAYFFISVISIGLYLYTPEIYPTRARAIGMTSAACWARIASFLGPNVVGAAMAAWGLGSVFIIFAVVAGIAALVAGVCLNETRHKVLEVISPLNSRSANSRQQTSRDKGMQTDETHRADLRSWVESANAPETDFPIQNLPFGIFRRDGETPRGGVAIGDQIFDLTAALKAGLLAGEAEASARLAAGPALNALMAADPRLHSALRRRLSQLLAADNPDRARLAALLVPMAQAQLELPAAIGNFTDFLTSIYHTERGGRVTRPDSPVPAPFRHLPIAYNGRATSVRASGEAVRRPNGQWRTSEGKVEFGPCQQLDFELELGTYVGRGNALGEPISIDEAPERIFGFCLLNDWSARDVQRWESALGPFLSKSLSTTISCWIVTAQALAPFRAPAFARPQGDPAPLPYLFSAADQAEGGIDISLDAYLMTPRMRSEGVPPARICRTNFVHMYWTVAQMLTHHMSNGCNMQTGDLFGSGTTSGPLDENRACLSEITSRGTQSFTLPNGETHIWLEDGDEVIFRGRAEREGFRSIGFGECRARVEPAPPWPKGKR